MPENKNAEITKVHVIFKTHLDIGFTELGKTVTDRYIHEYIPAAIELGNRLKNEKDGRFIWTTGSWLIYHCLKTMKGDAYKDMVKAIEDGIIHWHALPFTTHTELEDKDLFEFGLSLSGKLDKRFNRKTIAAKMTDVPGHTKAMIPLLAKAGVKFLHLGVNPASAVPNVPEFFTWVGADGTEIIVNYSFTYGEDSIPPCIPEALYFAHTPDNCGPQSGQMVKEQYRQLREKYPNAEIAASTMDEFAEMLYEHKDAFPKIYEEIGDSWIHGVASDPFKVSRYRELLRLRKKWNEEGRFDGFDKELEDFSLNLLMIPEHTWGMDIKRHLGDYQNYLKEDFLNARKTDIVGQDAEKGFTWGFENRSYGKYESSWQEQRDYLNSALEALPEGLRREAYNAYENLSPKMLEKGKDGSELSTNKKYQFRKYSLEYDENGSLSYLFHDDYGLLFDKEHRCGRFVYEEIGKESYDFWFKHYIRNSDKNDWAYGDFGKPFFEKAGTVTKEHPAYFDNGFYEQNGEYATVVVNMSSDRYAARELGCPRYIQAVYRLYDNRIFLDLAWNQKDASRLPESIWFTINPAVDNENSWFVEKMGELISPLHVVKNGGRNLHAIDSAVQYLGSDKKIRIQSLDAPVAAMGERKILRYDNRVDLSKAVSFNLYNNIWGTNFRMWYDEDTKFRFCIEFSR